MRILYLNPCGQMGGAETSLKELLASIRRAEPGWKLVLVLGEDGPMAARARELDVEVIVAPFPAQLARVGDRRQGLLATVWALSRAVVPTLAYLRRLAAIVRAQRPDLVHSNGLKMHVLGAWACPRRTPLIWHIHDYVGARPMMRRLLGLSKRRCAAAIANSKSVAADLRSIAPALRIETIYNAIDLRRFTPEGKRLDLADLSGLPPAAPEAISVGLVATFARWKGHRVFLEALSMLPSDMPVRGYVIGGPIYRTVGSQWSLQELHEEANRLGVAGRVGFTGFVDDTAAAIRSLDVLVHASVQPEPFGMAIIEGMACGRAVIASQAGGAAEIIHDGRTALAHLPNDAAGLARQIGRLATSPALRRSLGEAGRIEVGQRYDTKRLAQELVLLYGAVAGNTRETSFDTVEHRQQRPQAL